MFLMIYPGRMFLSEAGSIESTYSTFPSVLEYIYVQNFVTKLLYHSIKEKYMKNKQNKYTDIGG